MDKPQIKNEIGIAWTVEEDKRLILLDATRDALEDLKDFGTLSKWTTGENRYLLSVDSRYDFGDVVKYIESYGR